MPITQQRMIDLLAAAEDYEQALIGHMRLLDNAYRSENPEELKALVQSSILDFLRDPIKTTQSLASERQRIRFTRAENERRRAKSHPPEDPEQAASNYLSNIYRELQEEGKFSIPGSLVEKSEKEPNS
jgi:hypothetical protein